jgi:hypothetical protein
MISDEGLATVIYDTYQNKGQSHVNELKEHKVRVEVFPQNSNKRVRPVCTQKLLTSQYSLKKIMHFLFIESQRVSEEEKTQETGSHG